MIIDISSYNGKIDWPTVAAKENIERVIHRGTTKNGQLDGRLIENINGIATAYHDTKYPEVDIYKFSYARTYTEAAVEACNLIAMLKIAGIFGVINKIWLDLEEFDGRSHTTKECAEIIAAYDTVCKSYGVKFGIYCSYNYVKNILPKWTQIFDIWMAKWSNSIGMLGDFKNSVQLWQYTNEGKVEGIIGNVDISRRPNDV